MHCTKSRRWLRLSLLFLLVLLPLGLTKAEDKQANTDVHLKTVWAKLEAAVEAGKMSGDEAKAKMAAIKKAKLGSCCTQAIDVEAAGKKLKAAVKAGKLTEEEAKAKWVAIKKGACGKPKK